MKGISVEYPMYFCAKPNIFKMAKELRKMETDIGRSNILSDFGITVIRFTNEQILEEIDSTIKQIELIAKELLFEKH